MEADGCEEWALQSVIWSLDVPNFHDLHTEYAEEFFVPFPAVYRGIIESMREIYNTLHSRSDIWLVCMLGYVRSSLV